MIRGRTILIVDDDAELRHWLAAQLELHEEFAVAEVETADAALECIKHRAFDAILVDVGLPDMDGRELCRLMRRSEVRAPILMLTGAGSEADTILGLDAGASDYITKPFSLNTLLARVRAQLRQYEHSDGAVFAIGPYAFRPSAKLLVDAISRKEVELTSKETDLLKYLYRARDRIVGRDMLLRDVWGYCPDTATHTLEQTIYRLRKKIEPNPVRPEILVRTHEGYRLVL